MVGRPLIKMIVEISERTQPQQFRPRSNMLTLGRAANNDIFLDRETVNPRWLEKHGAGYRM